jgi:hypothetical protein
LFSLMLTEPGIPACQYPSNVGASHTNQ